MAHNPDEDTSTFQKTVVLRDWWLIKCSNEFEGKRFGVAATEIAETRAVRMFKSAPIIKAFDVFTLEASDGICIILQGFLNKERVVQSGFPPEISKEFVFGFPPYWEQYCNNCFEGVASVTASRTILSPCNNTKWNLEDSPVERRDTSNVTEKRINDKDGRSGGSIARYKKAARRKSIRLQSKSVEMTEVQNVTSDGNHGSEGLNEAKSGGVEKDECQAFVYEGNERKLDESEVKSRTNDRDIGSEILDKAKSSGVQKDECEAFGYEGNERKLDESEVKSRTNDGDHGSDGVDMAKSSDVEKDECEVINNEVISPAAGSGKQHTGADNVDKVTSTSATGESLTSEQGNDELEVTRAHPHSLFEDLKISGNPGKKAISKESGRTLRSDGSVVEPVNHSETNVKSAKNKRKLDVSEVHNPTTNDVDHSSEDLNKAKGNDVEKDECMAIHNEEISPDGCGNSATNESLTSERNGKLKVTKASLHSLPKDVSNSSKPGRKGKSKKSEKILSGYWGVVEPMTHSGSEVKEVEENLSGLKINRKIDFDAEVTPEKDAKKQKTNPVSADSSGQKRSRSGRLLVSSLEYWRSQIPVYDRNRNLIEVTERHETNSTPSKGKGSDSRKPRR